MTTLSNNEPIEPSDRTAAAIDVQQLHKYFGNNEVLKGIDFHVAPREVVCVIGPSGSGKSTLLRCVNLLETRPAARSSSRASRSPTPMSTSTVSAHGSGWSSSSSTCSRT